MLTVVAFVASSCSATEMERGGEQGGGRGATEGAEGGGGVGDTSTAAAVIVDEPLSPEPGVTRLAPTTGVQFDDDNDDEPSTFACIRATKSSMESSIGYSKKETEKKGEKVMDEITDTCGRSPLL